MLCDKCHEREATVFLTQIQDGKQVRANLCEPCTPTVFLHASRGEELSEVPLVSRSADTPTSIEIPDPIAITRLASVLHIKPYQVVAILMQHEIFMAVVDTIDFATAGIVCSHLGVTPRKVI